MNCKPGLSVYATVPKRDGKIVAIAVHKKEMLVATERRVYRMRGGRLVPVKFVTREPV